MKAAFGVASCTRVSMPSTPAMAKNTNDVTIMRRPMTEWLTAARRCKPRPGGPDRGELPVQPQRGSRLRQLVNGFTHFFASASERCPRERCGEVLRAMDDDIEPHPRVTETAEFGAWPS